MEESLHLTGTVHYKKISPDGTVEEGSFDNLVPIGGRDHIAALISDSTTNIMSHYAVGSDGTATNTTSGALGTEIDRKVFDSITKNTAQVVYTTTFNGSEGNGTIREYGIFNSSVGGIMLARTTSGTVTKSSGDILVITHQIDIS